MEIYKVFFFRKFILNSIKGLGFVTLSKLKMPGIFIAILPYKSY